jgi:methylglutaconyl-CoA hydratase
MLVENNSAQAMQLTREMIRQVGDMQLSEALDFASRQNAHARSMADCKRGIASFLDKTKPVW